MRFSGIIFICVVIFLHEASCVSFQRALNNAMINKPGGAERFKRQMQTDEQKVCIDETVGIDSACKLAILDELDLENLTDEQLQAYVNTISAVVCERDCRRAAIDVYEACGVFEDTPGYEDFIIGSCASDDSGKECYKSYADARNVIFDTEYICYAIYQFNDTCTCKADLEEAVEDIGCCLNVYHDYFVAQNYTLYGMPSDLYTDACDVTLPKDCSSAATSVIVSALSMMAALIFTVILQ